MPEGKNKVKNESNRKKYDDEHPYDAHDDVLLYRHTLLPKAEDLIEVYIYTLEVLLVSHPKGLFLFPKINNLNI